MVVRRGECQVAMSANGIRIDRLVDRMAGLRPDHPALIYGARQWTYARLLAEMDRRAAVLRASGGLDSYLWTGEV